LSHGGECGVLSFWPLPLLSISLSHGGECEVLSFWSLPPLLSVNDVIIIDVLYPLIVIL
jgi:hypothetical protein